MTDMENVVYQVLCHWRLLKIEDHPLSLGKNGDEQAKSRHEYDLYYIVSNIAKWMSAAFRKMKGMYLSAI